jgi:tight adherence protein B
MTVRNRFLFHAKVRALTAEARFSAVILGSLPFFVAGILMVITPSYLLPLVQDWYGFGMIGYMVTSYSFGVLLMYNVSNVQV